MIFFRKVRSQVEEKEIDWWKEETAPDMKKEEKEQKKKMKEIVEEEWENPLEIEEGELLTLSGPGSIFKTWIDWLDRAKSEYEKVVGDFISTRSLIKEDKVVKVVVRSWDTEKMEPIFTFKERFLEGIDLLQEKLVQAKPDLSDLIKEKFNRLKERIEKTFKLPGEYISDKELNEPLIENNELLDMILSRFSWNFFECRRDLSAIQAVVDSIQKKGEGKRTVKIGYRSPLGPGVVYFLDETKLEELVEKEGIKIGTSEFSDFLVANQDLVEEISEGKVDLDLVV